MNATDRLKFRGKAKVKKPVQMFGYVINPDEWITTDTILRAPRDGDSIALPQVQAIHEFWHLVDDGWLDETTIGQWTGLVDSKGVEIYEGDIVEHEDIYGDNPPEFSKYEVKFAVGVFFLSYIGDDGDNDYDGDILIQPITVIGTIHDQEPTNEN